LADWDLNNISHPRVVQSIPLLQENNHCRIEGAWIFNNSILVLRVGSNNSPDHIRCFDLDSQTFLEDIRLELRGLDHNGPVYSDGQTLITKANDGTLTGYKLNLEIHQWNVIWQRVFGRIGVGTFFEQQRSLNPAFPYICERHYTNDKITGVTILHAHTGLELLKLQFPAPCIPRIVFFMADVVAIRSENHIDLWGIPTGQHSQIHFPKGLPSDLHWNGSTLAVQYMKRGMVFTNISQSLDIYQSSPHPQPQIGINARLILAAARTLRHLQRSIIPLLIR
jgi:hypothetical protein